MTPEEAIAKLISVRRHCFVLGVLGPEDCYRQAFRTLNGLYNALKGPNVWQRPFGAGRRGRNGVTR